MILSGPDSALQWKVFDSLTKKDFYGNVPPPVAISWIMTKTGLNEFVSNAEGGSGKLILSWKVFFRYNSPFLWNIVYSREGD